MAGVIETTGTFASNDLVTSTKLNNIIDETTFTADAITGSTLQVSTGKLKVATGGITSNELASSSVTATALATSAVETSKIGAAAVTGAKLSGAQGGSAPVFGCRAYGSFAAASPGSPLKTGNVSSIVRVSQGVFTVTMTVPMENTSYAVVVNCGYQLGVTAAVTAYGSILSSSSFQIITVAGHAGTVYGFDAFGINFSVFG